MLQVTLTAKDGNELAAHVLDLAKTFGLDTAKQLDLPLPTTAAPVAADVELEGATTKKPRKKRASKKTTTEEQAPPVEGNGVDHNPPADYTKEMCLDVLKRLNATRGMPAARGLLLKFGAKRASDLAEADWEGFVNAGEALITGGA